MSAADPARRVAWVPLGGFVGVAAGAAVGALAGTQLAWTDPDIVDGWLGFGVLGLLAGGVYGGLVGLFVGAELLLVVGTVDTGRARERRAYAWGFVLTPVTMLVLPVALSSSWGTGADLTLPTTVAGWAASWPLLAGALLGGPLARRVVS